MKIITICGSMKFSNKMKSLQKALEQQGYVVFIPDMSENNQLHNTLDESQRRDMKQGYIKKHFSKIQQSDAILVANYDNNGIKGYIGSNTLMEIAVAFVNQKKIILLNTVGEQGCYDEVTALADRNLDGDISLI